MKRLVAIALLAASGAHLPGAAQTPRVPAPATGAVPAAAPPEPAASAAGRGVPEPKVQRIVVEDDRVRIDELRVRGQTRRIVVQPKLPGAPAYQLGVNTDARDPQMDPRSEGRALWQIFSF
jgi:hypothetical protein